MRWISLNNRPLDCLSSETRLFVCMFIFRVKKCLQNNSPNLTLKGKMPLQPASQP